MLIDLKLLIRSFCARVLASFELWAAAVCMLGRGVDRHPTLLVEPPSGDERSINEMSEMSQWLFLVEVDGPLLEVVKGVAELDCSGL